MTPDQALERYAAIHAAYGDVIAAIIAEDPDPNAIAAIGDRVQTLMAGLVVEEPIDEEDRQRLIAAASEAARLADVAAQAAQQRRIELREAFDDEMNRGARRKVAMNAYHAPGQDDPSLFVDRRN